MKERQSLQKSALSSVRSAGAITGILALTALAGCYGGDPEDLGVVEQNLEAPDGLLAISTSNVVALSNGVAIDNLSGTADSTRYFKLWVPSCATNLWFSTFNGTGDPDLYVRFGSWPTTSTYDCHPWVSGTSEGCGFSVPHSGTYYVMIRGNTAYSGVTLLASYSSATTLFNGIPISNLSGSQLSQRYYRIAVPSSATLTVNTSGGIGDVDLFTRLGALPSYSTYDCRSYSSRNDETCTSVVTSDAWECILLYGYLPYSGVTLRATF